MVDQAKKSHGRLASHAIMDSLNATIWHCRYLCRRTKNRIFKSLVIPVLLYGCETWMDTEHRPEEVFGTRCLCRIMGYYWYDFVSNQ